MLKAESVLKRMRWKVAQFLEKIESSSKKKCLQIIDELIGFEDGLMSLIKNIKFPNVNNTFQEQLENKIRQIKCNNKLIVPADKTFNLIKWSRKILRNT